MTQAERLLGSVPDVCPLTSACSQAQPPSQVTAQETKAGRTALALSVIQSRAYCVSQLVWTQVQCDRGCWNPDVRGQGHPGAPS